MRYKIYKITKRPASFISEEAIDYNVTQNNINDFAALIINNKPEPDVVYDSTCNVYPIALADQPLSEVLLNRDKDSYYYIVSEQSLKFKSIELLKIWSPTLKRALLSHIQGHIDKIQ